MQSTTFIQPNPHRGVRSSYTNTMSVILLFAALATALPSTAGAMSTFNFSIHWDATHTISGSFTSNAMDPWDSTNILTLEFSVPSALNGVASSFTDIGFDSTDPNHTLNIFKGGLTTGISAISATIVHGPTDSITDTWSWGTQCMGSLTTQCFDSQRREGAAGKGAGLGTDFPVAATITPAAVPEPATIALLGSGLLALAGYRWHQRRREGTQLG